MKSSNRKITLPQVCWKLVQDALREPGWATTPKMIVVAGTIDASDRIALAPLQGAVTPETEKTWADKEVDIELMAKEIEVVAAAIQYHVNRGAFRGNKYSKRLIEEFVEV